MNDRNEKILLSTALSNKKCLNEIIVLDSKDFSNNANSIIFNTICEMNKMNDNIDIATLRLKIIEDGNYEKIGGDIYLLELIKEWTTPHYQQIINNIKQNSGKRKIIKIFEETSKNLGSLTIDEIDENIQSQMKEIQARNIKKIESIVEITNQGIDELLKDSNFVKTGFIDIDNKQSGFYGSELIILAARPGMGKSALALQIARNVVEQEKDVLFFTLEMTKKETILRILSELSNIELHRIRSKKIDHKEKTILTHNLKKIGEKYNRLYVIDNISNLTEMRAIIKKYNDTLDLGLIVIDYLQLINHEKGSKERHLQIGEISRALKTLSQSLGVPVLALSQLNRGVETRTCKVPLLSDLRESGSLEQDANVVIFIHQEEGEKDLHEIIFAKSRNSGTGRIRIIFEKEFVRFKDYKGLL